MKKKVSMPLIIITGLIVNLIFMSLWAIIYTKDISLSYDGFGADSSGNIYIGRTRKFDSKGIIDMYHSGKYVKSIETPVSRSFAFTVYNDNIILSNGTIYIMDFNGNVIQKNQDKYFEVFNTLERQKVCIIKDGKKYILKDSFGRYTILCDNQIVFEIPLLNYILKVLLFVFFVLSAIFMAVIVCYLSAPSFKNKTKGLKQNT